MLKHFHRYSLLIRLASLATLRYNRCSSLRSSQRPWSNFHTFKTFFNTNHADFDNRIVKVFGEGCMWRSTKTNPLVKQQLNIPDQSETTHVVNFAPVEKAVYTKHFQEIQGEVRQLLRGGARSGDFEKVRSEEPSDGDEERRRGASTSKSTTTTNTARYSRRSHLLAMITTRV